jgi:ABC-type antimicrobial peptide transport system permease subunit
MTVVGLAEPARYSAWDARADGHQYYVPYRSASLGPGFTMLIQAGANARDVLARLTREPGSGANGVQLSSAVLAEDVLADTIRRRRLQSWVFGAFASSALVIVGTGILGLIGMLTSRREREIGIRIAAGASRIALVRLILREQLAAVAGGLTAGTVGAAWLALFSLRAYAYGPDPLDPRLWLLAVAAVMSVTLAAVLVPAARACRVDPVQVLKAE